jgi:hypothetical protein
VSVALGAAHAYKFAALFGTWLADLALDPALSPAGGSADARLALFAIDRPSLGEPATNLASTG